MNLNTHITLFLFIQHNMQYAESLHEIVIKRIHYDSRTSSNFIKKCVHHAHVTQTTGYTILTVLIQIFIFVLRYIYCFQRIYFVLFLNVYKFKKKHFAFTLFWLTSIKLGTQYTVQSTYLWSHQMSHFGCQIKYLVQLVGTKTQIFFSTFSQIVFRTLQHLYSIQNSGPMYHSADDSTDIYLGCHYTGQTACTYMEKIYLLSCTEKPVGQFHCQFYRAMQRYSAIHLLLYYRFLSTFKWL